MLKLQAKGASELTNTIELFIVNVHRNEAHFTYIYVLSYQAIEMVQNSFLQKLPAIRHMAKVHEIGTQ